MSHDFSYRRRPTVTVRVGDHVTIGSDSPVRLQSMTNTSTMDTEASVRQCLAIAAAGADIVRLTAQGVREAENLRQIRSRLRAEGCDIPLVADIHFNPAAAFAAAETVEKVRINPGNFVDPGRTFKKIEYTDAEYEAELRRLNDAVVPFLEKCRANSTAVRIGVNHGSLSDRIMSRYGDTPAGMVESAMEFLRVCKATGFDDVVISIKASNVLVMVETVRRLVRAMDAEDMHYPLHIGVTEAGDGEDGRVKSAVGIGTLLAEGIGDTIRVSLSEDPTAEIPVARTLSGYVASRHGLPTVGGELCPGYDPVAPRAYRSATVAPDYYPAPGPDWHIVDAATLTDDDITALKGLEGQTVGLKSTHPDYIGSMLAAFHRLAAAGVSAPVVAIADYGTLGPDEVTVRAAVDFGSILLAGFADGLVILSSAMTDDARRSLGYGILQATRLKITKTEYIACPGCGRTLFDLQQTLHRVKEATAGLKGLKIGVMGCIVNGPGEMADADYGYVGAGKGRISLYKGKTLVEKNIPADEAIPRLLALLRADGRM